MKISKRTGVILAAVIIVALVAIALITHYYKPNPNGLSFDFNVSNSSLPRNIGQFNLVQVQNSYNNSGLMVFEGPNNATHNVTVAPIAKISTAIYGVNQNSIPLNELLSNQGPPNLILTRFQFQNQSAANKSYLIFVSQLKITMMDNLSFINYNQSTALYNVIAYAGNSICNSEISGIKSFVPVLNESIEACLSS